MIFVHKIKNDNKKLKKSEKMEHPNIQAYSKSIHSSRSENGTTLEKKENVVNVVVKPTRIGNAKKV